MKSHSYVNIPNALSLLRLAMVPFMVFYFTAGQPMQALLVFILASITDAIDGYLARRLNQITLFGKLIDPAADKIMLIAMLACLGAASLVPLCLILIMVIKELLMTGGTAYLFRYNKTVVIANAFGKIATALFFATVVLVIIGSQTDSFPALASPIAAVAATGRVLMYLSLCAAILALVQYARQFLSILKRIKSGEIKPNSELNA